MKINFLNIKFQNIDNFFESVDKVLKSGKKNKDLGRTILKFDSEKTFNKLFTLNKLQILRAISQFKPESVYRLAMHLGREPQHVLKDCRLLETLKFIRLDEVSTNGRATLLPVLTFEYDVIKVYSKKYTQPFAVSERAEKLLIGTEKTS